MRGKDAARGRGRESSALLCRGWDTAGEPQRGVWVKASGRRAAQEHPDPGCGGKRGDGEEKRCRTNGAIREPVPETDPNGRARRKNGEEAEVRTGRCGDGEGGTATKPESKRVGGKKYRKRGHTDGRTGRPSKQGARDSSCEQIVVFQG